MTQGKFVENLSPQNISEQAHNKMKKNPSDDGVDLKELCFFLWEGKFIIALASLALFLMAVAYSLSTTEKWETKATVIQPELSQYNALQIQIGMLKPVFREEEPGEGSLDVSRLESFLSPKALLSIFIQQFNSRENKRQYIDSTVDFQKRFKAVEEEQAKIDKQQFYHSWYDKLIVSNVTKNRSSPLVTDAYELIAKSNTSISSYELLKGYLEFTNIRSQGVIQENIKSLMNAKKNELEQQVNFLKERAKTNLLVETQRSEYALEIAKLSGLSRPLENYDSSSNSVFSIALGSDALGAKVKVLDSLENLSIFEPMIAQKEAKLSLLNSLNVNESVDFQMMQFVEEPQIPHVLSAPNRKVISIAGAIFGLGLGVVIVLVRAVFRKK